MRRRSDANLLVTPEAARAVPRGQLVGLVGYCSGTRGCLAHRGAEGVAADGLSEHAIHTEPGG
jgi:hypothetical protein